jgi:hypothetical protein
MKKFVCSKCGNVIRFNTYDVFHNPLDKNLIKEFIKRKIKRPCKCGGSYEEKLVKYQ